MTFEKWYKHHTEAVEEYIRGKFEWTDTFEQLRKDMDIAGYKLAKAAYQAAAEELTLRDHIKQRERITELEQEVEQLKTYLAATVKSFDNYQEDKEKEIARLRKFSKEGG